MKALIFQVSKKRLWWNLQTKNNKFQFNSVSDYIGYNKFVWYKLCDWKIESGQAQASVDLFTSYIFGNLHVSEYSIEILIVELV